MSSQFLNEILEKTYKSLDKLVEKPKSNLAQIDLGLVELAVLDAMLSWVKKRRDAKQKEMVSVANTKEINKVVHQANKHKVKSSSVVLIGDTLSLNLDVSSPALRLSKEKLKQNLMSEINMTDNEADEFISECSEYSEPAKSYRVREV